MEKPWKAAIIRVLCESDLPLHCTLYLTREGGLFGGIDDSVVKDLTVPVGDGDRLGRSREAVPDVLHQLESRSHW